jgi:uncharacterized membrane protein YdjX (TVP38/TMEM64 family)
LNLCGFFDSGWIGTLWQFFHFFWQVKCWIVEAARQIGEKMDTFLTNLHSAVVNFFSLENWSKKRFGKVLFVVVPIIILWVFRGELRLLITIIGDRDALVAYLEPYGTLGIFLLYVFLFLQVFIATIPGQAIMVTGGYLYGFWIGLLIAYTSTVVASHLCYELARRYGRPLVKKLAPAHIVDKWTVRAERQGIPFFIFSFTTPIFPADVMNFVAGLIGLPPRKFMIANVAGRLPSSIVFTLIGSHGLGLPLNLMIIAAIVFTFIALGFWRLVGPKLEEKYMEAKS